LVREGNKKRGEKSAEAPQKHHQKGNARRRKKRKEKKGKGNLKAGNTAVRMGRVRVYNNEKGRKRVSSSVIERGAVKSLRKEGTGVKKGRGEAAECSPNDGTYNLF